MDPGRRGRMEFDMSEIKIAEASTTGLIERMVLTKQLSSTDAAILNLQNRSGKLPALQTEEEILRWLAKEYGVAFTTLDSIDPDRELLSLFPARVLLKAELLPLQRVNGTVEVATSRLFATQGLDTLKTLTGLKLKPVLAPGEAIRREMKKHLGVGADTIDTLDEDAPLQVVDESGEEDTNLDSAAEDASIIKFVNQVLTDAIELRASDIHLEPFEDELRIRYRIDGVLQEIPVPAQIKRFQPAIVSRVKILSHLNIAEKRLPQDGRIKIRLADSEVDIRVSIIPMLHGEAVVMRLLRQKATLLGMEQLGLGEVEFKSFQRVLALPHGIILVTGPTGSGKTSTLYTALSAINDAIRKIITIEDPIEYQLRGVNQIQVSEKSGLTFARGLRSILRHDPDVILEADPLVQYLILDSQANVLCPACKAEDTSITTAALKEQVGFPGDVKIYRAVGCAECRGTGYFGRHAIFEWMDMNNEIRHLVLRNASSGEIREAALRNGLRSLSDDGWRLIGDGITTVEEVMRVTKDQTLSNGKNGRATPAPAAAPATAAAAKKT